MNEYDQKVAAIVLAAGESQRMGALNKLHLHIDRTPMLRHSLEIMLAAGLGEIIVVLGYEHQKTSMLLEGLAVRTVYNDAYLNGQMTSVHCGLAAIEQPRGGIMVALGDQPALTVADINILTEAYANRGSAEVVIPGFLGKRGNPIIISDRCRQDILAGQRNLGCRRFIENNPGLVHMVEMPNPAVVINLDTPQEYQDYCLSRQFRGANHPAG